MSTDLTLVNGKVKIKVKQSPLQAWTVPEGSSKLGFPDFVTTGTGWW